MISPKFKEKATILASFGLIGKEVDEYMKKENITQATVLDTDEFPEVRECIRLLQKMEIALGSRTDKIQKYLNKSISNINGRKKPKSFINGVVGLSVLMLYKEHYKNKKVLKGISWNAVNDIYAIFEKAVKKDEHDALIASQYLADDLYKELLK